MSKSPFHMCLPYTTTSVDPTQLRCVQNSILYLNMFKVSEWSNYYQGCIKIKCCIGSKNVSCDIYMHACMYICLLMRVSTLMAIHAWVFYMIVYICMQEAYVRDYIQVGPRAIQEYQTIASLIDVEGM